ncbi:MAG: hypothetical protein JXJ17_04765 [Anaerolineae bacterium]|nr:hypothetical protein [Anaerolineae bacterium]
MVEQRVMEQSNIVNSSLEEGPTVSVKEIHDKKNVLLMTWQQKVDPADVRRAFQSIQAVLDSASAEMCVVVDLRQNPVFPLTETMISAIRPYQHHLLAEWLIIGSNRGAKAVEGFLSRITGRNNVLLFNTESEALAHCNR